jgi:creatinine amidohydrolase
MIDRSHREQSWTDGTYATVGEVADSPGSTMVVPVGSVEQHGHHLPVGTDTFLVDAVVRATVQRVGDELPVLPTPPIWTGCSPHHLSFGGTLSVERETLLSILADVAATGLDNGFDALLLVNGHGGNRSPIGCAVSDIGADHPDVTVSGVTYFDLAADFVEEIRDSDSGGMAHGGEFETSLMLHRFPELVREDEVEGTPLEDPADRGLADMFDGGPLSTYHPFEEYSESGAVGVPEAATAVKGEELFEGIVDELSDVVRGIHDRSRPERPTPSADGGDPP